MSLQDCRVAGCFETGPAGIRKLTGRDKKQSNAIRCSFHLPEKIEEEQREREGGGGRGGRTRGVYLLSGRMSQVHSSNRGT